jgi:hypothetical protein
MAEGGFVVWFDGKEKKELPKGISKITIEIEQ